MRSAPLGSYWSNTSSGRKAGCAFCVGEAGSAGAALAGAGAAPRADCAFPRRATSASASASLDELGPAWSTRDFEADGIQSGTRTLQTGAVGRPRGESALKRDTSAGALLTPNGRGLRPSASTHSRCTSRGVMI
eukprot:6111321-Prymnesium_polylepis.1